jgi:hypothetical protein
MKRILVILILALSIHSYAQTKEQRAQMEKELKELEKDDPEMAKKVRSMMKPEVAKVPSNATASSAKFVSPITPIPLKQPVTPPTEAQAKDHLLWYKGKKINDSVLITSGNTIVLYQKRKNKLVVQPAAAKDPFKKMVTELSNTEKRKTELINSIASKKNSFFFYPMITAGLQEYESASKKYGEMLKNTVELPPAITSSTSFRKRSSSGYASTLIRLRAFEIPAEVKRVHDEAMQEMKNYPPLDFPPPPQRDFSYCYDCDSNVRKKYEMEVEEWQKQFNEYERTLAEKAISVERSLALGSLDADPDAIAIKADMNKVLEFCMNRTRNKVNDLIRDYGKDFGRVPAVIQQAIGFERQRQLLGVGQDSYGGTMDKVVEMLDRFDSYLDDQMKARNYNVVMNVGFGIGIQRQKQLIGGSEESGAAYFDKIMAFNRFRLNMDIDGHIVSDDLKADAGVISSGNVYVSLAPIGCRFQFFLTSTDYENSEENSFRIPMKAKGGIKSVKEKDDKWVNYPYSGPTNMLGLFPVFSINFCDEEKDTVYLQPPINRPEDMANVTAASVQKAYTIDHTAFLGMLYLKGTEEAAVEGNDIATEMLAAYTSSHLEQPTGNEKLDHMQDRYNLTIKSKELQDRMSVAINRNTLMMLFNAQNQDEVIVDGEVSPSHRLDEIEVKGTIKLKIVHDPIPYQPKPPSK